MAERRRWGRSAVVSVIVVAVGVLLAMLVWAAAPSPNDSRDAAGALAPAPEPVSSAPAAAIQAAHDALHHIGSECGASVAAPPNVDADVSTITGFARRYPVGRFPIDDETGTAVSLLLVTRQALEDCAPAKAELVDRLLPLELQYGSER